MEEYTEILRDMAGSMEKLEVSRIWSRGERGRGELLEKKLQIGAAWRR